ncbi:19S_PA700 proteasome regulatory particle subunit Rpt5p_S6 [Enterospora canceri]|uniref:26S proteasome regulatory subunit 6A n=1 Tax=Enterospora canceri TaxID=1081671 RepID=A0A1Y1SA98_9MICR|nr:19S_PA700 proteasome regulatory particle subunit Rpt5p_S6 [Enterospora canceri]
MAEYDKIEDLSPEQISERTRMIQAETRMLGAELSRVKNDTMNKSRFIVENMDKIKLNKNLPYLVGNVLETFKDGDGNSGIVNSSTRQTSYLEMLGLVPTDELKPGDSVALHKETNVIFEKLPATYDSKVLAMELDGKPAETYDDIGGMERQIEELTEAIVLPLLYPDRFSKLNIQAPKGVLMYGPPGTGKTLMARACAAKTNATFLKLAGPQLVQMYIGDGARMVRETFQLAREKRPCIIFIDEIDAIGTKRSASDKTGDREVQRTMLELLNELDGFTSQSDIKIIAATNRVDILDPALLRSGRLDRKIEFPLPTEAGRKRIMQIHARKMQVDDLVDFEELARSTEGFNGAQCKAVCIEAGMSAIRGNRTRITQVDFANGINDVLSKKKSNILYFT